MLHSQADFMRAIPEFKRARNELTFANPECARTQSEHGLRARLASMRALIIESAA